MGDFEWKVVGKKKKKKGRGRKQRKALETPSELVLDPPVVEPAPDFDSTTEYVLKIDDKMRNTVNFSNLLPAACLAEVEQTTDLVVLGAGSPSTSSSSSSTKFQVNFATYLAETLKSANKIIFDPSHTPIDVSYLMHCGWHVPHYPKSEKGCRGDWTSSLGLWFMPHCPRELYKMVLENNSASRVVIIGNSFTQYVDSIDKGGPLGELLAGRKWRELPMGGLDDVGEAFSFTSMMVVDAAGGSEVSHYSGEEKEK